MRQNCNVILRYVRAFRICGRKPHPLPMPRLHISPQGPIRRRLPLPSPLPSFRTTAGNLTCYAVSEGGAHWRGQFYWLGQGTKDWTSPVTHDKSMACHFMTAQFFTA